MLFSTLEGIAIYSLALYIFRFDFKKYVWHCLVIIEIINLQNYLTRVEAQDYAFVAPVVNLLITILFMSTIVRIPLFWSALVSIVSYTSYLSLQTLLIWVMYSLDEIQADPMKGYIIQFLTAVIGLAVGTLLYRRGFGFSFDFNQLRFKQENILVIILIFLFLVLLAVMMYLLDLYLGLFGFMTTLFVFLYYSFRKEAEDV